MADRESKWVRPGWVVRRARDTVGGSAAVAWPGFLERGGAEDPRGVVADEGRGESGVERGRGVEARDRVGGQFD
jgi:hypothetical protein